MKSFKILFGVWAVSTFLLFVGGDVLRIESVVILVAVSVTSGLATSYQFDRYAKHKAQHELNERLKGARR